MTGLFRLFPSTTTDPPEDLLNSPDNPLFTNPPSSIMIVSRKASREKGFGEDEELLTMGTPMAALRFPNANHGMAAFQDRYHAWYALTIDSGQTWQREEIPVTMVRHSLYLAHDGKTLTMFSGSKITVLRHNGA